jgi:putative ABC transport system ATP-binding protein
MEDVEIKNLTKTYKKNEQCIYALNNVSILFKRGSFIAVTGTSGSGKSTLLHIIAGIDKPTSGEVIINGTKINELTQDNMTVFRRKNIGLVYQFFNLVSVLNVEENILLPYALDGKKADIEKLNYLLKRLNLDERRKHYPAELSGGQQQRVAIARAIYNEPSIILADEPTGNLDSLNRKEVLETLKKLHKEYNITIILVTHDSDIAKCADRVITLSDGTIIKDEENNDVAEAVL